MLASAPALADLDDVREELARNIQTAQRELSAAETTVGRERGELAQRLLTAQNRVLDLRERAVAARRLADEETLTLQQIETRLETWREQGRFQSNLLAGFLDRTGRRSLSEQQSEIDMRGDLPILADARRRTADSALSQLAARSRRASRRASSQPATFSRWARRHGSAARSPSSPA